MSILLEATIMLPFLWSNFYKKPSIEKTLSWRLDEAFLKKSPEARNIFNELANSTQTEERQRLKKQYDEQLTAYKNEIAKIAGISPNEMASLPPFKQAAVALAAESCIFVFLFIPYYKFDFNLLRSLSNDEVEFLDNFTFDFSPEGQEALRNHYEEFLQKRRLLLLQIDTVVAIPVVAKLPSSTILIILEMLIGADGMTLLARHKRIEILEENEKRGFNEINELLEKYYKTFSTTKSIQVVNAEVKMADDKPVDSYEKNAHYEALTQKAFSVCTLFHHHRLLNLQQQNPTKGNSVIVYKPK